MRGFIERLTLVACLAFAASLLALAAGQQSTVIVASIAAVALAAALAARYAATVIRSRRVAVGERAREHRESIVGRPEPQHPDTAGRPRTRAPSGSTAVA